MNRPRPLISIGIALIAFLLLLGAYRTAFAMGDWVGSHHVQIVVHVVDQQPVDNLLIEDIKSRELSRGSEEVDGVDNLGEVNQSNATITGGANEETDVNNVDDADFQYRMGDGAEQTELRWGMAALAEQQLFGLHKWADTSRT